MRNSSRRIGCTKRITATYLPLLEYAVPTGRTTRLPVLGLYEHADPGRSVTCSETPPLQGCASRGILERDAFARAAERA
jgi:hypothetical protein